MTIHALVGLAGFTLRRIAAGRRVYAAAAVLALGPLVALLVSLRSHDPPSELFQQVGVHIGAYLAPLLLALVYGIAITTSEVEDGTAGYVFLAALRREVVALVQVVVTGAGLAVLAAGSVAATWAIVRHVASEGPPPSPALAVDLALAAGLACLPYLACVSFCGYAFRHGIAASVIFGVIGEVIPVAMPVRFALYTITNNVRAVIVATALHGDASDVLEYSEHWAWPWPSPGSALAYLAVVTVVALALAAAAAGRRRLVRGDAA
ncbi:MAG TPA: hypothetical protein VHF22_07825 [Planctomycetota bacterium]|nr:hypothetical protein [Planctomycetota bacterium]